MVENSQRIDGTPHFEIRITDKNVNKVVKTLVSHVKKDWDLEKLQCKVFDDGISNKLLGYYVKGLPGGNSTLTGEDLNSENLDEKAPSEPDFDRQERSDIILVRIYGNKTELIIDRARELRNFQLLCRNGLSPPIYNTFENGYCYGYVEGRVLSPLDVGNPVMAEKCARLIGKLHSLKLDDSYLRYHKLEATIFESIDRYLKLAPKMFPDPKQHARFEKEVPSMEQLRQELLEMKDLLSKDEHEVAFCHNDLLCANFIYKEDSGKITMIDYEYGCPNYVAYDIGNHFNEFAGVDKVDYDLYPDKEFQMKWIRTYLEERECLKWNMDPEISDEKLEEWYIAINQFSLICSVDCITRVLLFAYGVWLSHLFWGIWALIQAYYSEIDFDFLGYGIVRLNEYFRQKESRLALSSK